MRTPAARTVLSLAFLLPLAACSVDRYAFKGRVVAGTPAGASSVRDAAGADLAGTAIPYATVRLVMDPDDSLHRRELGSFRCDAAGRFDVRDVNAPGVEVLPYTLRVEAYAQTYEMVRCDIGLPGPGRELVVRMVPQKGPGGGGIAPATPSKPDEDYLRQTLRESEPYLK